jgi:hypothetical protein
VGLLPAVTPELPGVGRLCSSDTAAGQGTETEASRVDNLPRKLRLDSARMGCKNSSMLVPAWQQRLDHPASLPVLPCQDIVIPLDSIHALQPHTLKNINAL